MEETRRIYQVDPIVERRVLYHMIMLEYVQEFYPEIFAELETVDLSAVPYLEANTDFRLLDMLNWATKMNYDI